MEEQYSLLLNAAAQSRYQLVAVSQCDALPAEGLLRLASKPVLLLAVAGREVEWDKSGNACSLCDVTGLTCGKMLPLCGNICSFIEKRRLDEKLVSTARERNDPFHVPVMICGVDDVCDLLSLRGAQGVLLEQAERNG